MLYQWYSSYSFDENNSYDLKTDSFDGAKNKDGNKNPGPK